MYRIAICDDSIADGSSVQDVVTQVLSDLEIEACLDVFLSANQLWSALVEGTRYDLYLLDILMGDSSGMTLAGQIRTIDGRTHIIFITSSPDYALDGYKVRADDYILKPITYAALASAIGRMFSDRKILTIKDKTGLHPVVMADIRYIEAFGHMVRICTKNSNIAVRGTLVELLQRLRGAPFFRCHKSYLVNLEHVHGVRGGQILLLDGDSIPLGRRYSKEVQLAIMTMQKKRCTISTEIKGSSD